MGSPSAPRHLRADPGDPDLLRVRERRQRPLHHRRRAPSDDALAPRARREQPPAPHLDQRALHVHAWVRRDARAGEPRDPRGTPRALHPRHSPRLDGREPSGDAPWDLLRRAEQRPRVRAHGRRRVRPPERRVERVRTLRRRGRHPPGLALHASHARGVSRQLQGAPLGRHRRSKPSAPPPRHRGTCA